MRLPTIVNKLFWLGICLLFAILSGCASVPMAPKDQDAAVKTFSPPPPDQSAIYVFRNSFVGQALRKMISIDGAKIGESANNVYFYKVIAPGMHTITTESEFGDNSISFQSQPGKNYFARQYIKMGVFVGGSNLEMVSDEEGKKAVLQCNLAQSNSASPASSMLGNSNFSKTPDGEVSHTKVPYINGTGQQRFSEYLTKEMPRAFAISDNGHYGYAWGTKPQAPTFSTDPKERALKLCAGLAGKECVLFSVDNEIVFRQ